MYTEHFGLPEQPFHVTPDPRFFYPGPAHQEAYAALFYGVSQQKGFIVLTGEVGTGKTTILRRVMANLGDSVHFAFIYNTTLTFDEILDAICHGFHLPIRGERRFDKIQTLNAFLLNRREQKKTAAILMDEAHNLSIDVLENLRLLSNVETENEKLLQIVLVGQSELESKLTQPALRQLKDRVAIWCRLKQLQESEVGPFILHRLRTVGYEGQGLFTSGAIQRIAVYSQGSPRRINILCDNALLLAYGTYQKRISAQIVEEVAQDLLLTHNAAQVASRSMTIASPPSEPQAISFTSSRENTVAMSDLSEVVLAPTTTNNGDKHKQGEEEQHQGWSDRLVPTRSRVFLGSFCVLAGIRVLYLVDKGLYEPGLTLDKLGTIFVEYTAIGKQSLNAWMRTGTPPAGRQSEATAQTKSKTGIVSEPVAQGTLQRSEEPADEKQKPQESISPVALLLPPQSGVKREDRIVGNKPPDRELQSQSAPSAKDQGQHGQFVAVPRKVTILSLVSQLYGDRNLLALDLVKEMNPQLSSLDRVSEGERLWMPALTRETLLRLQPDGSYRLVLTSFRKRKEAERLARTVRNKGYSVTVSPQPVSDSILLYRVEVSELQEPSTIERVWELAQAQNANRSAQSLSQTTGDSYTPEQTVPLVRPAIESPGFIPAPPGGG